MQFTMEVYAALKSWEMQKQIKDLEHLSRPNRIVNGQLILMRD